MKRFKAVKIKLSKYLRVFKLNSHYYFYHSYLGNAVRVSKAYLIFLELVKSGITFEQLKYFPYSYRWISQIKRLLALGLFVCSGRREDLIKRNIRENAKKIKTGEMLEWLVLNLSGGCNLACEYCNVRKTQEKYSKLDSRMMSYETAKKAIDDLVWLNRRNNKKQIKVCYFGGEPLLNISVFEKLIGYVHQRNKADRSFKIGQGLNTNGVLLNETIIRKMKKYKCHVGLSLDGLRKEHDAIRTFPSGKGSYALVVKNMKLLKKYNIPTLIITTVGEHNYRNLIRFINFIHKMGFKYLNLKEVLYNVRGEPEFMASRQKEKADRMIKAFIHGRKKGMVVVGRIGDTSKSCEGIGQMLSVEPNGEVYPCPGGIQIKLGTVANLLKIPETREYKYVASRIIGNLEECKGCEIEGLCKGGCAAEAQYKFADIYRINPDSCDYLKELVKRKLVLGGS